MMEWNRVVKLRWLSKLQHVPDILVQLLELWWRAYRLDRDMQGLHWMHWMHILLLGVVGHNSGFLWCLVDGRGLGLWDVLEQVVFVLLEVSDA